MYNTEVMLLIDNCYILIDNIKHYVSNNYLNKAITDSHIDKINKYKSIIFNNSLLIKSDANRLTNDLNKVFLLL